MKTKITFNGGGRPLEYDWNKLEQIGATIAVPADTTIAVARSWVARHRLPWKLRLGRDANGRPHVVRVASKVLNNSPK